MQLKDIKGIGNVYEKKLKEAGIMQLEDLVKNDLNEISEKTGIGITKLKKWRDEAKKKIGYKKADIIEDIQKISFIEIKGNKARVKIKNYWHENVPVYRDFKEKMENEIAVYVGNKVMLWFNGKWHENVPYKSLSEKIGFFEKIKELLRR